MPAADPVPEREDPTEPIAESSDPSDPLEEPTEPSGDCAPSAVLRCLDVPSPPIAVPSAPSMWSSAEAMRGTNTGQLWMPVGS